MRNEINIQTIRLLLRRPTKEDDLVLGDLWRNESVRTFLGGALSDEMINKKLEALQEHWDQHRFGLWAVLDKSTKKLIGVCGPHSSEEENIEISYMFFPQFWGKGFAKEAAIVSISYSFQVLNLGAVIAITQDANLRSCRLLESIGMRHFNTFERYGAVQRTYKLTQNEWRGIR